MTKAKPVIANPDEPVDLEGGGEFVEWAMVTVYVLRIELSRSHCFPVDLLSGMPGIIKEIGLTRLPHCTVLRTWFEQILTIVACVSWLNAEKRTGHAAIDSTVSAQSSLRQSMNYRVRALRVTALVDVEVLYITNIHSTTSKKYDANIGPQVARRNAVDLRSLAAGPRYDIKTFRD